MGRQIVGVFVSALAGLVGLLLAIGLAFAISLAGTINLPRQIESVLVCLVAVVVAFVAGRIGRTAGATLGVVAVLILELLLALFQQADSTVQMAMGEPKWWLGLRVIIGLVIGSFGQRAWTRKAARLVTVEAEALGDPDAVGAAEPVIEQTTADPPKE